MRFLTRLWAHVQQTAAARAPPPSHRDLDLILRVLRDLFTADVERLVVDDEAEYARIREFAEALMPQLVPRVHLYGGTTPLFEQHGVETKISRALERRVWLKSGGYLVIDQTESLTTIDVNTGRYVGKKDQEETVLRTNSRSREAGRAPAPPPEHRRYHRDRLHRHGEARESPKVFDSLQERRADKARSTILQISELGLVQMTRKRTRESLGSSCSSPARTATASAGSAPPRRSRTTRLGGSRARRPEDGGGQLVLRRIR